MLPVTAAQLRVISVLPVAVAVIEGATGLVNLLTPDVARESPASALEVQIKNEYCVPAASPVMALLVASAVAVVVVPALQFAGADDPD